MRVCEACGQRFDEPLDRCVRCGRSLVAPSVAGHLSRTSIAGAAGTSSFAAAHAVGSADTSASEGERAAQADAAPTPASEPEGEGPGPGFAPGHTAVSPRVHGADAATTPSAPSSPEWDPDATTRFTPIYASRSRAKNTAALVGLAIGVVAAVTSLAGLIAQSVVTGPANPRGSTPTSASPTPLSTVVPRNATVCTPELARSSDTNCTVAQRVFSAVRTLGTDLPDSFRVTITDPGTDKNATFVCSIEAWIQCVGDDQAVVYVRRLV
ncbi:MAG TPA: hypothetical protein PLF56_04380 [Micropruina sp.]|nr:hypothetical protein [Micropruina sp.]